MGLLQWAYETYESHAGQAGIWVSGQREPLTPVSHLIQNAHIELSIHDDGTFCDAGAVPKEDCKTIIPVTEASAGRTSGKEQAHPLCEQLLYLASYGGKKHDAYLTQLTRWAEAAPHPKTRAVLAYVRGGTILKDLEAAGVIQLDEAGRPMDGKVNGTPYDKCLVRWRVLPAPDGGSSACWEDSSLFENYIRYYTEIGQEKRDFCMVTGQLDAVASSHPKGIVSANFGAKLVSSNDSSGFTYRGRFSEAQQSGCVGYPATQKAHSALRWVAANQGVVLGGRTFLCWNPGGRAVPSFAFLGFAPEDAPTPEGYRRQLGESLSGYRLALENADGRVVIAALDAATTGRLSVTYYNLMEGSDFLNRLQAWYESCCWPSGWGKAAGVRSPSARQIVNCAFGTQQGKFIQADDRLLKEYAQRLLHCIVDLQPIPVDVVRSLAARASTPLAYDEGNRDYLLTTACAVIRKYNNDKWGTEEWTMALDRENNNRSYLFGRLLAVAEQAERSAKNRQENRDTNAIRMQSVFCQRPMYAWAIIERALEPYYGKLDKSAPGLLWYFKGIVGEIVEKLPGPDDPALNAPLEDVYLLGYYLQRNELTRSGKIQTDTDKEENEA